MGTFQFSQIRAVGRDGELEPISIRQRLCKTIHNYYSHPGGLDTLKYSVIRLYSHHRLTSSMLIYQSSFLAVGFYSCPSRNRIGCIAGVLHIIYLSKSKVSSFLFFSNKFMKWNWRTAMYTSSTQVSSRYNLSARSKRTEVLGYGNVLFPQTKTWIL